MFARSLATAKPLAGVDLTLLARNNEILGTGQDRRERPRHLHARPDARRRRHAAGRADGQPGRQRLRVPRHEPRRLRPFRPRRRRARLRPARSTSMPGPNAASTASANTSMSARLPATRPRRPSRTCRSPSSSRGRTASRTAASSATASRPAAMPSISTSPTTPCAAPGRSRIYTDPKKEPVATQMFLVEDFVPDRIEFDLSADKTGDRRRRAGQRHRRRPLPLWRAGRRPCPRGRGQPLDDPRMEAFPRLLLRPCRRAGRRCDPHPADRPAAGRRGRQGDLPGRRSTSCRRRRGCSTPTSRCACARPAAAPSSARLTSTFARIGDAHRHQARILATRCRKAAPPASR